MEGAQAQLKRLSRRSVLVLIAVVVLAAVAYTQWPRDEKIERIGSRELGPGRVDIAKRVPSTYEIVYLSRFHSGRDLIERHERIVVRRPFDALEEPGGVSSFTRTSFGDQVLALPPDIAEADARPAAVLPEALRTKRADERERRRVAGRVCRVYRLMGFTIQLDRLKPSADDYLDVCIDEAGLVLEELYSTLGEVDSHRVAQSVDESPEIDKKEFDLGEPSIDASAGGNFVQELKPDSRVPGGKFWDLDSPLEGFDHRGRFAVIESDLPELAERKVIRTSVTDVWTRGIDVVFIERFSPGPSGRTGLEIEEGTGDRVDAGEIGKGDLIYSLRTSMVSVATGGGRVVQVRGTLAPSRLVAIARRLEPLPEGPLTPLSADRGSA